MIRKHLVQFSFLLAGIALAAIIITGFLWYGAGQEPAPPFQPAHHQTCGEPVALRTEDYNRWGSTRGDGIEVARLDFCDPVRAMREDGQQEVWFWLSVEITGQVYPYAGWGYPWQDVETPFPADDREPRNPWWAPHSSIRAVANELGYTGGDGFPCPLDQATARGLDLFFYRDSGFQLPVGTTHSGWVCIYFDNGHSLPDSLTLAIQPDRARVTQWVDKLFVVRDQELYGIPAMPVATEDALCDFARRTHPDSIQPGGGCDFGNS
jgi:hypothetical protein